MVGFPPSPSLWQALRQTHPPAECPACPQSWPDQTSAACGTAPHPRPVGWTSAPSDAQSCAATRWRSTWSPELRKSGQPLALHPLLPPHLPQLAHPHPLAKHNQKKEGKNRTKVQSLIQNYTQQECSESAREWRTALYKKWRTALYKRWRTALHKKQLTTMPIHAHVPAMHG